MDPARSLLQEIVDYAGLFPPTAAPMAEAVAEYARQRATSESWMLGSFVVGAGRLDELATAATRSWGGGAWPLSVLLGPDPLQDLRRTAEFVREHPGDVELRALEFRPSAPEAIAPLVRQAAGVEVFCELPWRGDLEPWLGAVRTAGARAKIRCGGVTADLIPPVERVADFLFACHDAGVGLKFTAGLHHPVRSEHPLTYEPDAPRAVMHGFLNVFVAAALLASGPCSRETLVSVLGETDPAAFRVDDRGVAWRDQRVDAGALAAARAGFARSFGSCSFAEPVADLQQLGLP